MDTAARARKNESVLLERLALVGLEPVATALDVDISTVSRMKGEAMQRFATLLAALNFKIVPTDYQCHDPAYLQALHTLAERELSRNKELPLQIPLDQSTF